MKAFLLSILLLVSSDSFSQSTILYNADGTLKADEQFRITKEVLLKAPVIEKELLASVYNNLKYPAAAKENNFGGMVIVKFTSMSGKTSFEIAKSSEDVFKDAITRFFKSKPEQYLVNKIGKHGDIVFYLPIKFQMINGRFKETLSTNKALTIEAIETAPDTVVISDDAVKVTN